jgi:hypothetical protein
MGRRDSGGLSSQEADVIASIVAEPFSMGDDEGVVGRLFRKNAILPGGGAGHGRLVAFYALALVIGSFPWVMEASGLARPESRAFLFERFVSVEWALAGALVPFAAAKLARQEPGPRLFPSRFLRIVLFASELVLVSVPLAVLLRDMGVGSGREWLGAHLELLSFLSMLAAVSLLLHLVLEPPLAALGASYAVAAALVWIGGGFELWLALGAASLAWVLLRNRRSLLHAE